MSTIIKTNYVAVQLADRNLPGTYSGREYTYIADKRLAVGDIVYADTRLGGTLAKVVAVDVQEHTIAPKIRPLLKHITDGPLPPDKVPQPRPQAVTQMTLG